MTQKDKKPKKKGLTVLSSADKFHFACHSELGCFTQCCRNITIFLTPYDIIRMKNSLRMPSDTFLKKQTTGSSLADYFLKF